MFPGVHGDFSRMHEISRAEVIPAFEFHTEIPLMAKTQFSGDLFDRTSFPQPVSCSNGAEADFFSLKR
jgi:hypothetical protein